MMNAQDRAARLEARLAHVPRLVALRAMAAIEAGEPPPRGALLQLDRFYAHLAAMRRPPECVAETDFAAVAPTRTRLYQLLGALERFAPEVPLVPARALRRTFDKALNDRYGAKPRRERQREQIAVPFADWPDAWREAWRRLEAPTHEELLTLGLKWAKPLAASTLRSTRESVGLFLAAFVWAAERGVALPHALGARTAEMFARFLRNARGCRDRSVVAHLERVRRFGRRGLGLGCVALEPFNAMIAAWTARARQTPKRKVETLEAFYERHSLADIPVRAAALAAEAAALPGHRRKAERLRVKAAVFALTVNAPERLADLQALRFGRDGLSRHPSGVWSLRVRQGKNRKRKTNPALWPETGAMLDALILGDRRPEHAQAIYEGLVGCHVLSLSAEPAHRELASVIYREEFGISQHAVRTLIVDLFKMEEPESAAACRALLGHRDPAMHEEYRTDLPDAAAMRKYRSVIDALAARSGLSKR